MPVPKLKILFTAANLPSRPLKLEKEHREINAKVRAAAYRDAIEVVFAGALRPMDLNFQLNEHHPQVVHFSGHGEEDEIVLLADDDSPLGASRKALVSFFRAWKGTVRLVVLNACSSKAQAEAITEVIDCAVGMSRPVGDDAAISFAVSFYSAIAFGCDVQNAFDQAVALVEMLAPSEADIPQLLCRAGVDPSQMVLVPHRRKQKKAKGSQRRQPASDAHPATTQRDLVAMSCWWMSDCDPDLLVSCPRCSEVLAACQLFRHYDEQHVDGDSLLLPLEPDSLVTCPYCQVDVQLNNLRHHYQTWHPDEMRPHVFEAAEEDLDLQAGKVEPDVPTAEEETAEEETAEEETAEEEFEQLCCETQQVVSGVVRIDPDLIDRYVPLCEVVQTEDADDDPEATLMPIVDALEAHYGVTLSRETLMQFAGVRTPQEAMAAICLADLAAAIQEILNEQNDPSIDDERLDDEETSDREIDDQPMHEAIEDGAIEDGAIEDEHELQAWLQVNVRRQGTDCLVAHCRFRVERSESKRVLVAAFVYLADGSPMQHDGDSKYQAADGQLSARRTAEVADEETCFDDFVLWLPQSELAAAENCYIVVQITDLATGSLLQWVRTEPFDVI